MDKVKLKTELTYKLALETTKLVESKQSELKNIKWFVGEANIDTEFSQLVCRCCELTWNKMKTNTEYAQVNIICNIPDVNIVFTLPNGEKVLSKIELKSSKKKIMPGSTIKKLEINQPLIYCLRPSTDLELYKLKCSQYHSAMGESEYDLFQDRTPRPNINFDKMDNNNTYVSKDKDDWITHYSVSALNRIKNPEKYKSWQDTLTKDMKEKIINDYVKNTSQEEFKLHKLELEMNNIIF
jgi:hypothetical protein